MTDKTLRLLSPAKLNVFLEILGKRPDGFHELETVMLRTQLADTLTFTPRNDSAVHLSVSPTTSAALQRDFPLDDRNLILRAARCLQRVSGFSAGANIVVEKVIPPESGLAGGSSNAASTLMALNELWDLQLPDSELHAIAAQLGSDINFLLSGFRAAVCRGRGELIESVAVIDKFYFVAVRPLQGNRTADVFQNLMPPTELQKSDEAIRVLGGQSANHLSQVCFNRLTTSARRLNSEMAQLLDWLESTFDRPAFMSGSGSTCFIMARDKSESERLHIAIAAGTGRPTWTLQIAD